MTTFTQFAPTPQAPFSFMPTLDGQQYNAVVIWNLFGQRWYLNLYTLSNVLVLSIPLMPSPTPISILSLSWANGFVTAATNGPHGFILDATVDLTISGCAPDAYNGTVKALIVDPQTIEWPLASNPGTATQVGVASYDIDLVEGYFDSTLVFRDSTQNFEVSP